MTSGSEPVGLWSSNTLKLKPPAEFDAIWVMASAEYVHVQRVIVEGRFGVRRLAPR
jgi:hypothetical protein